jgi:hypothetical protein
MNAKIDETFNTVMGIRPDMAVEDAHRLAVLIREVHNGAVAAVCDEIRQKVHGTNGSPLLFLAAIGEAEKNRTLPLSMIGE